uniref:Putative secreted protein n=1 Tax=Panstrongylus lignarius TaxID=156445 RepID=A0A224Y4K7_9HEMI
MFRTRFVGLQLYFWPVFANYFLCLGFSLRTIQPHPSLFFDNSLVSLLLKLVIFEHCRSQNSSNYSRADHFKFKNIYYIEFRWLY